MSKGPQEIVFFVFFEILFTERAHQDFVEYFFLLVHHAIVSLFFALFRMVFLFFLYSAYF